MGLSMSKRRILVAGAAGYIGCHTLVALIEAGYDVVAVDNFMTSSPKMIAATRALVKRLYGRSFSFIEAGLHDSGRIASVLRQYPCEAAIHFAALKAVAESVQQPLAYYENNVSGTLALLRVLREARVFHFVFSSSATVYGDPVMLPVREDAPCAPTNPYGRTKHMIEQILADVVRADPRWQVAVLRYFNPVGAHESGEIGEDSTASLKNLVPLIAQVAIGKLPELNVYGDDWQTPDGTGLRDYLHVMDLAEAHVASVRRLLKESDSFTVNLGTGKAVSVLEMVRAFEQVSGYTIKLCIAPRRPGDIAVCYADPSLAARLLGWRARRDLLRMCTDTWRWHQNQAHIEAGSRA